MAVLEMGGHHIAMYTMIALGLHAYPHICNYRKRNHKVEKE
jgi:hypothetical protein